ncbi:hypothetical protein ACP4OV_027564 [Aristida adscensionis]
MALAGGVNSDSIRVFNPANDDLFFKLYPHAARCLFNSIRNDKARRYLSNMRKKPPIPFTQKFPGVHPMALHLLEHLLAFDPKDRLTAAEALADPYFTGLANPEREPIAHPISKMEFEFERRKLAKDDVRELIYREILEYHPQMLHEYLCGGDMANFVYPSGVDRFKRQFAHLQEGGANGEKTGPQLRQHVSLPRERVNGDENELEKPTADYCIRLHVGDQPGHSSVTDGLSKTLFNSRNFLKSESIGASQCVVIKQKRDNDEESISECMDDMVDPVPYKIAQIKT